MIIKSQLLASSSFVYRIASSVETDQPITNRHKNNHSKYIQNNHLLFDKFIFDKNEMVFLAEVLALVLFSEMPSHIILVSSCLGLDRYCVFHIPPILLTIKSC